MKKLNPVLVGVCVIMGVVVEQVVSRYFGGAVVAVGLVGGFAFLIGVSIYYKKKGKPN